MAVTVTDKKGNIVTDLTRDDFEVIEDGKKQTVEYFAQGDGDAAPPMHLGLMLDASGSMQSDMKLAQGAAIKFLNMLPAAEDITLVDFDTQVRITRYPQRDFARLVERIRQRKPDGWTALYDALGTYLDGADSQDGRKVLVMYTDGGDSRSALVAVGDADAAEGVATSPSTRSGWSRTPGRRAQQMQMTLRQMAEATGGQAFFPTAMKDVESAYDKVLAEIKGQYHLGYHSTNTARDGAWRKVEIRVKRPDVRIRVTQGLLRPLPSRLLERRRERTRLRYDGVLRHSHPCLPSTGHFNLASDFELAGDQVHAVPELVDGLNRGDKHQVLLGVTGSGKTYTMAQVIARVNRPTLVMAHNKTLAAQLYQEFRRFFPDNAVEYFVSYYDYYQPEAYVPSSDTYIEKESTINDEIDRMRLSATRSLFERRDVIIVASVSCIYGLGSPEAYYGLVLPLEKGQRIDRDQILRKLVEIQYERNDHEFARGTFRVRGDIIEVYPSYEEFALRIGLFGDEIDELTSFDPLTGKALRRHERTAVYPKSHFVTSRERLKDAVVTIKAGARGAPRRARARGQGARGAAAAPADDVRSRDDQGDRLLPRHRELLAPPDAAPGGAAAADAARLPAVGCADGRRREPPDGAAGARHVSRRPLAQGSAGRVRLPPAVGARQPAAELRGVGSSASAS